MKLVIATLFTFVLFYIAMGAPVDNLDEDYDYAIALLSACTVFLHIKKEIEITTNLHTFMI